MKTIISICIFLSIALNLFGQTGFALNKETEEAQPILEEGKRLYTSEMASWHGTDIFISQYANKERVQGYFSYTVEEITKCVFYSNEETPTVLGQISFNGEIDKEKAILTMEERKMTELENEYLDIRTKALDILQTDKMFKFYSNTNPNIIPLIDALGKRVYILTAPAEHGTVIFGNDYLITFNEKNEIESKKALHNNMIPLDYSNNENEVSSMHMHLESTGPHMTATDICTLMLYGKYTPWENHYVYSKEYMSIWKISANSLFVLRQDIADKIYEDVEERRIEREKAAENEGEEKTEELDPKAEKKKLRKLKRERKKAQKEKF